jgi:hypothetical protein
MPSIYRHGENPTTPAPTLSAPLNVAYICSGVMEDRATAKLRAEIAALRVAVDTETDQLNAMLTEVQFRNEEDLSLVATLLMEAVEVRAQV